MTSRSASIVDYGESDFLLGSNLEQIEIKDWNGMISIKQDCTTAVRRGFFSYY